MFGYNIQNNTHFISLLKITSFAKTLNKSLTESHNLASNATQKRTIK